MYNFFNLRNFRNGCYMGYHCILIVAVRVSMEERLLPGPCAVAQPAPAPAPVLGWACSPASSTRTRTSLACLLSSSKDIARMPPPRPTTAARARRAWIHRPTLRALMQGQRHLPPPRPLRRYMPSTGAGRSLSLLHALRGSTSMYATRRKE
jgi:hypothetical protein